MSDAPAPDAVVRPATVSDLERIAQVEVEAGQLFLEVGLPEVAGDEPRTDGLLEAVDAGRIWVAEQGGVVAAYVLGEVLDGAAHVAQVSVAPSHARRGIGRLLVERVEEWGRAAGRPATTLTTFTEVPWNGPYYARLGYTVLPAERIGPELARTMAHEATFPGLDRSPRCAMVKPNEE